MFCLETKRFRLELLVVPVRTLLQHEETIAEPVRRLMLALKNQAHLHNPIIVDENHVVLDGNHRAFAFKELEFKHIAACKIDYLHDQTKLRYWYRHLRNSPPLKVIKQVVEELQGHLEEVSGKELLLKSLDENRLCCGIQKGDAFLLVRFDKGVVDDAVSAYGVFNRIQERLLGKGSLLEFIPCSYVHETDFCVALDRDETVLWSPRITKEMVITAAKQQKIFTPKATRHLIPARPLNVDVPTEWFREDISLEAINLRFVAHLKQKRIRRLGPGQIVKGRYYEEELFVFYD